MGVQRDRWRRWRQWEVARQGREQLPLTERWAVLDALMREARALGAWPPADPLAGIERDVGRAATFRRLAEAARGERGS